MIANERQYQHTRKQVVELGHIGMYIGGGMVIHAPQTGDVVKISPLSNFNVVGASRPG